MSRGHLCLRLEPLLPLYCQFVPSDSLVGCLSRRGCQWHRRRALFPFVDRPCPNAWHNGKENITVRFLPYIEFRSRVIRRTTTSLLLVDDDHHFAEFDYFARMERSIQLAFSWNAIRSVSRSAVAKSFASSASSIELRKRRAAVS